jgi:hypothetical protein
MLGPPGRCGHRSALQADGGKSLQSEEGQQPRQKGNQQRIERIETDQNGFLRARSGEPIPGVPVNFCFFSAVDLSIR